MTSLLSQAAVERVIELASEKNGWSDERPAVRLMFTALAYHDAAARIEKLEQALAQYESVARRYLEIGEHMNFRRDLENARNAARAALAQTGEPTG